MRGQVKDQVADDLRAFCEDAVRQMAGIEMRLRTLAAARQEPEIALIEEAVASSLQLAKMLLDAGRQGRHATLLAVRPLLRALAVAPR
jgi:hypothetical protein